MLFYRTTENIDEVWISDNIKAKGKRKGMYLHDTTQQTTKRLFKQLEHMLVTHLFNNCIKTYLYVAVTQRFNVKNLLNDVIWLIHTFLFDLRHIISWYFSFSFFLWSRSCWLGYYPYILLYMFFPFPSYIYVYAYMLTVCCSVIVISLIYLLSFWLVSLLNKKLNSRL